MWFEKMIAAANDALYGYILIIVLIAGGLYFTVRTKGAQFRLFGAQIGAVTEKPKDGSGVSSFQALMVSTASRVGTGNIIGVSAAVRIPTAAPPITLKRVLAASRLPSFSRWC